MSRTWEVTWPCRKQHVGWPTVQMVCSWRSRVCSLSTVTLVHGTRNFIYAHNKARPFKTPTNGQQQHCAHRSQCHRQCKLAVTWAEELQACHSYIHYGVQRTVLTFRHRASYILGQAFHYSPENAFYILNQQIYFIVWYLLDRASLI